MDKRLDLGTGFKLNAVYDERASLGSVGFPARLATDRVKGAACLFDLFGLSTP